MAMNKQYLMYALVGIALGIVASVATYPTMVHAEPYCINGTWLGNHITLWNADGTTAYDKILPSHCVNGCDSKLLQCNPSQWEFYTGPIGVIGLIPMLFLIVFLFAVIYRYFT